jgi:hypothetical protein
MNTNPSPTPEFNLAHLDHMAQVAPPPLDPLDLTSFALSQDFNEGAAKKVLTTVPVKKPAPESFVRTHTDPACWAMFGLLELKVVGKIYLVKPAVAGVLRDENESTLCMANLVLSVDRRGNPFLWPLKVSQRENDWNMSALRAAEVAKGQWVRVTSNMSAGCYDTSVAASQEIQPVWPSESYKDLLALAFRGRVIDTPDHPVLQELRGH